MYARYLASAPLGIAVTLSLLYVMQVLIEIGAGSIVEPPKTFRGEFVRQKVSEEVATQEEKPDPIDPPEPLPTTPPLDDFSETVTGPGLSIPRPVVTQTGPGITDLGHSDGALISIMKVSPSYPVGAAQKGLEGWVIVKFDVTALGTIDNIVVVQSSHSIFNKPAKAAAARFRYKPRVVDGVAQAAFGLMHKFVFRMEE
jgi:protein TonB